MNTADFALDLRASLTPPQHIGVGSGRCVVQPWLPTVCGVGEVFSPPIAARGLRLQMKFTADGHAIRDDGNTGKGDCGLLYAGGRWLPDRIERLGTYHHIVAGRMISLGVRSTLVPLFSQAGFVLLVTVRNRGEEAITLDAQPDFTPGSPNAWSLDKWEFPIPPPGGPAVANGPGRWSNGAVDLHLIHHGQPRTLQAGGEAQWQSAVIVQQTGKPLAVPDDLAVAAGETIQAWTRRLDDISTRLPTLQSSDPELDAYYRRAIATGLVCLWDRDDFVCNPFVAISGMDGGGICAYPWDICGYPPKAVAGLLGERGKSLLKIMGTFGLDHHMLFTPSGLGQHHYYAYSAWAYISFVWAMACQYGPDGEVFDQACAFFLKIEQSLNLKNGLADYGIQKNLLEMRGAGWEHIVASPNAERVWCFDRLADLGEQLGRGAAAEWRAKATEIRHQIREQLWDTDAKWFRSVYPDGHIELVYSIQAFDALRAGACSPEMETAILSHVRDGAFLGRYGVSSVSAEDEKHYELNDPDWSGGGAYSGDGPQLALTLYEVGQPKLAWDVLRRHFWMGQHLAYFPQEHYCDRPAVAGHKRSNIIGGCAAIEAVLFGLVGLSPRIDGSLWINPQPPAGLSFSLRGYAFRGRRVDVEIAAGRAEAIVDGVSKPLQIGQAVRVV